MRVPFVDLYAQYKTMKPEMDRAITEVINKSAYIRGEYVEGFEKKFAKAYGMKHCISLGNGTDAIYITLKMLGMGRGSEVITAANTWISTSETVTQTGARVVFADEEADYFTIDPKDVERKITKRTKAIIPVHLYGQAADMKNLKRIAKEYKLTLIEDCAQAHFAEYHGKLVGKFGKVATFSFYPGKNLGAYGDAGAVLTDDDNLAEKVRMYANHGSLVKHEHLMEGVNSRMDGIQAAVLSVKLKKVKSWNRARSRWAEYYNKLLADVDEVAMPKVRNSSRHVFHVYAIRAEDRDRLQMFLRSKGIETAIHYPTPLPFLRAYKYLGHKGDDFPVARQYQDKILSLPMFAELTPRQIEYVVEMIKKFY